MRRANPRRACRYGLAANLAGVLRRRWSGAKVEITQGSFPQDRVEGVADTNGVIEFQNIFEGSYAVCASQVSGPTTVFGRVAAAVSRDQLALATVRLSATATLRGTFVKRDLITPILFAQVGV